MNLVRSLLAEPALSASAEAALAPAARRGDTKARNELVRASLRLVALRVSALGFRPDEADDAFQIGALALLRAVEHFDPGRGVRLSTYAWPWISHALGRERRPRAEVPHELLPEPAAEPADDLAEQVQTVLAVLGPREHQVLQARYLSAADSSGPAPWDDVAAALGTSVSTARRIGAQALSRLRHEVGRVGDRAPDGADPP